MFNVDDRKRLAALVNILITIDNKTKHTVKAAVVIVAKKNIALPARDKAGRFVPNSKATSKKQGDQSLRKARKKSGPYLFNINDYRVHHCRTIFLNH